MHRYFVLAVVAIVTLLIAGCGGPNKGALADSMKKSQTTASEATKTTEEPAKTTEEKPADDAKKDEESVADTTNGKKLYSANCASCHVLEDAGSTGTFGPDLDDLKPTIEILLSQIENGGGGMPAALVSGDDAQDVAAYVVEATSK